uniref:Uncharacterized protein n=1 Tax=Glossina brevipalpis TaxID=37001 RepID=A0A1A9W6D7_9MUSC
MDSRSGATSNARRPIRIVPDWTENAVQGEHFWKPTSASGDLCCLNEECIDDNKYIQVALFPSAYSPNRLLQFSKWRKIEMEI